VGANADEGSLFTLSGTLPKKSEEFRAALDSNFGPQRAATLCELYPPTNVRRAVIDLMGDYLFNAPARSVARAMQHAKAHVFLYHFAHPTPGAMGKMLGAHHGAEIAYVLDNLQLARSHSSVDEQIRDTLVNYWIQFATAGNPNRAGLPDWPAYDPAADRCLLVGETITTAHGLRKARLDAIDGLMGAWRSDSRLPKTPRPAALQPKGSAALRPAAITPNSQSRKPGELTPEPGTPAQPAKQRTDVIKTTGRLTSGGVPHLLRQVPEITRIKTSAKLEVAPVKGIGSVRTSSQANPHTPGVVSNGDATGKPTDRRSGAERLPIPPEPAWPPTRFARNEIQSELRHARFLIKAGLSPIAAPSLQKIIKEAPGTSAAREAQQSLESLPKAK